jgi:Xaa-Pro aminopeptidase
VHYQPSEKTNKKLEAGHLLLVDSGGQYLDGTTDVTRTVAIGTPTKEMIADFTQVLKAHIALAQAHFPEGTGGIKLDVLARAQMWQIGADYKHGTGHGVACFGNVHEGPLSISINASNYGLKPFMVVSDEPGIYKENAYGIRIENLLYIKPVVDVQSSAAQYLKFVTLTKVPIDKRLIDTYLLNPSEIAWLNTYHQSVYGTLSAYLTEPENKWLKEACSPL